MDRPGRPDRAAEHPGSDDQDLFRLLAKSVTEYAIFLLDPEGRVTTWNAGAERIKGYRADEIVGRHFSAFYPAEDLAAGKPEKVLAVAAVEGRVEDEGWRVRKDGSRFWASVVVTALYDGSGRVRGFGKVTRDESERRAAEEALRAAVVELQRTDALRQRLLARLVQAQENERRRIASDIHDDVLQAIVALAMRLQLMARKIDDPERRAELDGLDDAAREVITRMRNLLFRVRPPALDRGVACGLADYLEQVSGGWGFSYDLEVDVDVEPPPETALTIFRIVQEAVTNVHKHARASRVQVHVSGGDDAGLVVRVRDDGVGIPADVASQRRSVLDHFGLSDMRERAEMAGGTLDILRPREGGTMVECRLPVTAPEEMRDGSRP